MLKKHPKALSFIFFTEMWERVGFYTLMAILVLYMDRVLGWSDARKGDWYGVFLALCYFVPLFGGWLGDRLLGRLKTVQLGAVLMAVGYVGLGISSASQILSFGLGLLLIAVGTGIFKVNMSVLVGNLYQDKPELKDAGFNIFYMGVNLGAMIAPLIATFNNAVFRSYHLSFWVSAVGLILALIIFHSGKKYLKNIDDLSRIRSQSEPAGQKAGVEASEVTMSREESRARILSLVTLFLIIIFFWLAFYQNAFGLTLFAARSVKELSWLRPETYQFFEPFFILVLTPPLLAFFSQLQLRKKEPSTPRKIFFGLLLMIGAMLIMILASLSGGNLDNNSLSPLWLISCYFVITLAEILISPMGQSFVSKVAPPKIRGLMMGGWFAAIAAGAYGSGLLGKYYSAWKHHVYFSVLAGLLVIAALLVLVFLKYLERFTLEESKK